MPFINCEECNENVFNACKKAYGILEDPPCSATADFNAERIEKISALVSEFDNMAFCDIDRENLIKFIAEVRRLSCGW